jgi:hypothetical protein
MAEEAAAKQTEEAAAVTAEGYMARQGIHALLADLAGGRNAAIDKACLVTARRDLRYGPDNCAKLPDLHFRRRISVKGQAEPLYLLHEIFVDLHIHLCVPAKYRIADAAEIITCDLFRHMHPSWKVLYLVFHACATVLRFAYGYPFKKHA